MILIYRGLKTLSIHAAVGLIFLLAQAPFSFSGIKNPKGNKSYQLITGDDSSGERNRWDALFSSTNHYVFGKEPAEFVKKNVSRLPLGRVLDIAMGEGRNAVFLAKKGFEVEGVDFSPAALRKARRLAREHRVTIKTINADLLKYEIKQNYYDVILNIEFLERSLIPKIKKGLKEGGVIVFENHTVEQIKNKGGQSIPRNFLLNRGELKALFSDFEIILYREVNDGKNAMAQLIARKPKQ